MQPILAATGPSPRAFAVQRRAGALARQMKAPLERFHSDSPFVAARIAERAQALDAQLVVMGAGAPGGARRLLGLSRAHAVQRRIAAPVLVVQAPRALPYQRIVVASDLCASDAATLAALRERHPQAALHLVHVYQWHLLRPLRHAFVPEDLMWHYRREAQAEADAELRRFVAAHGVDRDVRAEAVLGHVALGLRQRVERLGADLLVLSPERSRLKAMVGASVTQALLADPPCDVLLAPRPQFGVRVAFLRTRGAAGGL
ncbi:MAG TPA: universal stress protein [Burkholderiales bacterium]